jgi:hypothetical protein
MESNWDMVRTVERGSVSSMIRFGVVEADLVTVKDLTGYAAWVSFSYPGAAPHVMRAATLSNASSGIVLYATQGDEFPTVGMCRMQLTLSAADTGIGVSRGFFDESLQEVRREVMEVPA